MAGRIREQDIAEVRERNRIDEVIGDYVALRGAGAGAVKGLCPFHDEKSPSFNVRPNHGTFHCFGCGEGGDVIAFVMKMEHLTFVESVERLADRAGIRLTYTEGGSSVQRDRGTRSRLIQANAAAQQFYAQRLRDEEAGPARDFLLQRGFDGAAAERFGCGYAPAGWERLTKHLLAEGFTLEELYKAGLSREGRRGPMDRFHRRLLWPIRDLTGEVVGFGARRLFDDDPIEAKYVNTSDTPVYRKSQVLFGLDQAKREIARRHQAVVVEGYTDVMAMHLAGVPTAVASCGTAFGDEHIGVLRRLLMDDDAFRGEVIYTFDGDEAGQKAALKAFDSEQKFAARTYIAVAPDGQDPCELRQGHGDAAVRDLVARRQPLFEFALRSVLGDYDLDSSEGRVGALRRCVPLVASIKDVALRDDYARRLAGWVGWPDEGEVVRGVRQASRQQRPAAASQPSASSEGAQRPDPKDERLWPQREALKLALQVPVMAGPVFDSIPVEAFSQPAYAAVRQALADVGGVSSGHTGSALLAATTEKIRPSELASMLSELAVEPLETSEEDQRYAAAVLAAVQQQLVAGQVADVKSRLTRLSPVNDPETYRELWGDLVALEEYNRALRDQAIGAVQ